MMDVERGKNSEEKPKMLNCGENKVMGRQMSHKWEESH